jgi:hypothetical protein
MAAAKSPREPVNRVCPSSYTAQFEAWMLVLIFHTVKRKADLGRALENSRALASTSTDAHTLNNNLRASFFVKNQVADWQRVMVKRDSSSIGQSDGFGQTAMTKSVTLTENRGLTSLVQASIVQV